MNHYVLLLRRESIDFSAYSPEQMQALLVLAVVFSTIGMRASASRSASPAALQPARS